MTSPVNTQLLGDRWKIPAKTARLFDQFLTDMHSQATPGTVLTACMQKIIDRSYRHRALLDPRAIVSTSIWNQTRASLYAEATRRKMTIPALVDALLQESLVAEAARILAEHTKDEAGEAARVHDGRNSRRRAARHAATHIGVLN